MLGSRLLTIAAFTLTLPEAGAFMSHSAYDRYRDSLAAQAHTAGWRYLDLWNAVPPEYGSMPACIFLARGSACGYNKLILSYSQLPVR
ncbi:MAG TPA: hypothetical protein VLE49_10955 [Anaerolineales bacterium]|nr:hypothetical protein [Anaerolineales bacterium]